MTRYGCSKFSTVIVRKNFFNLSVIYCVIYQSMQNLKALIMVYKSQSNIIVHKNYNQKCFFKNAIFPVFRIFLHDRARCAGIFFQIRKVEDMAIHMVPKNFKKMVSTYGFGGLKHCTFFIFRPK